MPLWGAAGMYPAYRLRSDRNDNLADRIQACFRYSLNGIAPAHDAPEMRALLAYTHFVAVLVLPVPPCRVRAEMFIFYAVFPVVKALLFVYSVIGNVYQSHRNNPLARLAADT